MKKTTIFKGIALLFIAVSMVSCKPKTEPEVAVDKEKVKEEIQALENSYAIAMTHGEIDDLAYYASDATSFSQNKPAIVGKVNIHKNMKEEIAGLPKGAKLSYITDDVFPSSDGNHVLETGVYKVMDSTNVVLSSGNFMAYFEKRDGKYICVRDMAASEVSQK